LQHNGIQACTPGRRSRWAAVKHDKRRYRRRNRIEIVFGRLKSWRRVMARHDRCPGVLFIVVAPPAIIRFWL
jgi:transposase